MNIAIRAEYNITEVRATTLVTMSIVQLTIYSVAKWYRILNQSRNKSLLRRNEG